jgi:ribonucleoside-diphosphate reductase alpha chain
MPQLNVIKRNGKTATYDQTKIETAITKAFLAVEGDAAAVSDRIHETVQRLSQHITEVLQTEIFQRRLSASSAIYIEDIQDQVELALMRASEHKVARAYVLYREKRRQEREQTTSTSVQKARQITVVLSDGAQKPLDLAHVKKIIDEACAGLTDVDPDYLLNETLRNLYDGVPIKEVNKALQLTARALIEKEPNHTFVAARLLLHELRNEALDFLGLKSDLTQHELAGIYKDYLKQYISKGIALGLLDSKLQTFDLEKLANALDANRDMQFTYLGLQTLYDRYFIHYKHCRFELPQAFFMRVAMGLAMNESHKEEKAIEFYRLLSSFDYMSSTPTLFNSGTPRPQLSSCFLSTVPDDLDGIFSAIKDNALLSKFAGGLGNDWTPVRSMGAHIKGTNGQSQGVVVFLNVLNATAVAVNQGGKRKGAVCAYLETWHLDMEEFLDLRKNTGDDRRRTHDINTANWIPDLFMQRVFEEKEWTLFSPDDVNDLHDLFGKDFEKAYIAYEEKVNNGEIQLFKKIPAITLWRKMLSMLFETGHPWMTFKDACNIRSPQQHVGVIHSSNLCTEITLNTSAEEIAVCNLGSINVPAHINAQGIDHEKLKATIKTAVRMLDNVIDINYYSVPQARNSNFKHRPVGLGIMGFQDALYKLRIPYGSEEAVEFADRLMETVSYYAIEASSTLAEERGAYQSYPGSLWSQGILPIDSIELLQNVRGPYLEVNRSQTFDWQVLRNKIQASGMRNSNVLAIAPTATISNICGVAQSIEPTYQNLYVKSNLSGEFTVINPYLVDDLKRLHLWDEVMVHDLKYYNGSLAPISRVPAELKNLYATAFEIDVTWLVEAGSRRQKWIDQAQSLNLYMAQPSGKKLDQLYRLSWLRGLKTNYYLRTLGATNTEKSTIHESALNSVQPSMLVDLALPALCPIDDPTCEACE